MQPGELGDEPAGLNRGLELAIREFTRRHLVAGRPPPPVVDELVARTVRCVLEQ